MEKKKSQHVWVYQSQPTRFSANEKERILEEVKELILPLKKISQKVSKLEMRANRLYLYELVEQSKQEGIFFTKSLIDGKYLEYPYARLTLKDIQGNNCTVDWQRHNNQWMTLYAGTLEECLKNIENDTTWF